MSAAYAHHGERRFGLLLRQWRVIALVLFLLALFGLCAFGAATVVPSSRVLGTWPLSGMLLALAAALYLSSHLLRALRLTMLAGNHELSLRRLTLVHYFTSGVSLLLPFKLGEVYRVIELRTVIGDLRRSMVTVWIERGFDVGALLGLTILALSSNGVAAGAFVPLAAVSAVFLALTVVALIVLPENLQSLSLFILRRYRSERAVMAMRAVHAVLLFLKEGRRIMTGKFMVIGTTTVVIWTLELASLATVLVAFDAGVGGILEGFLGYISATSVQSYRLLALVPPLLVYGVVVRMSLLMAGVAAGLTYAPARLARDRHIHSPSVR